MFPERILEQISPHAQVATAVLPFAISVVFRLLLGKSRLMDGLVMAATAWFTLNIFVAPYSASMQQDLINLRQILP